jgi:hypothetical protein
MSVAHRATGTIPRANALVGIVANSMPTKVTTTSRAAFSMTRSSKMRRLASAEPPCISAEYGAAGADLESDSRTNTFVCIVG